MRLIDANTLKAEFTGNFQNAYTRAEIHALIDTAPTISDWISVEDSLPEATQPDVYGKIAFSDYVLVYAVGGDGFNYITTDICRVDHKVWLCEVPFDDPEERVKVTHWMPLPEPPEGDEE